MKLSTKKNLQVAVFNDGVGIKEVISTFVNSRKSEVCWFNFFIIIKGE